MRFKVAIAALAAAGLLAGCPTTEKGESLLELEALRSSNYTGVIAMSPADEEDPAVRELREQATSTFNQSTEWYEASLDAWEALEEDASEEMARQGTLLYRGAEAYSRGADARDRMAQAYANIEVQRERRNRYNDRIQASNELILYLTALERLYHDTSDCVAELTGYTSGGDAQIRAQNALGQAQGRQREAENMNADQFASSSYGSGESQLNQARQSADREDWENAFNSAMSAANSFSAAMGESSRDFAGLRDDLLSGSENRNFHDDAVAAFGDSAHMDSRGLVLVVSNLFADRRADVRTDRTNVLDQVVDLLRDHRGIDIIIEGHSSDSGASDVNVDLSAQRAEAVQNYLTSRDIRRSRLELEAYGESYPRFDNRERDGRADNNRVEIIFEFD